MLVTLRNYQAEAVEKIKAAYKNGCRAPVLVLSTGSGKTIVFCNITERTANKGNSVYILVHRDHLLRQTSEHLTRLGVQHGLIAPGHSMTGDPIQVASVWTLARRIHRMKQPALIIIDECFPAGILVDGIPIEKIRAGYCVNSFNIEKNIRELKSVLRTFKNKPTVLIKVILDNGQEIVCTPGHPFYSEDQGEYIEAIQLTPGTKLKAERFYYENSKENMLGEAMHNLREDCYLSNKIHVRNGPAWSSLLLSRMFGGIQTADKFSNDDSNQSEVCQSENDFKQPHEICRSSSEKFCHSSGNRVETNHTLWEWLFNRTSKIIGFCLGVGNGICHYNSGIQPTKDISSLLQGRHCKQRIKDSNRGRREFALLSEGERRGQKENGIFNELRVDHIEILEPGSDGKFGGMCPDGYVYNIEVEGNNNYFADGVLVHNCHHTPAGTWKKILETWSSSRILGVTATPLRLDGKGLGVGAGGFFDTMIEGPDIRWLINNGYLSQPLVYAPPTNIDLKGIRTQMGDYEKHELACRMDKPTITGSAITHYLRLCPNVPAILFAASVKHAEHSAEQFNAAGIPAASLTGELSNDMRKHRIQSLANGQIKILTSCEIISEGTDIPIVTAAILLRPTQSTGMYLQQTGRTLRPFPGKTNSIILDHVGNCLRHGLPDEPRDWELNLGIMSKSYNKNLGPQIKSCEKCFAVYSRFLNACPQCGHVNAVNEREIKQVDGELEKLTSEHLEKMRFRRQQGMATDLAALLAIARSRGYNPGWAHHVFNGKKAKDFKRGLSEQVRMAV